MQTNYILAFIIATVMSVTALPISKPMAHALVDALKLYMGTNQGMNQPAAPMNPPMPPPVPAFNRPPPGPAFMSPPPPPTMNPGSTNDPNAGLLMNMPRSNHIGGGWGGRGAMGPIGPWGSPFNKEFCPPGPQSLGSDACKEQKLLKALYRTNMTPRYDWVPPFNPYDTSISDNVKDRALHILTMKIRQRRNQVPSPQECELIYILGDPKFLMFPCEGSIPTFG